MVLPTYIYIHTYIYTITIYTTVILCTQIEMYNFVMHTRIGVDEAFATMCITVPACTMYIA